MDLKMNKTVIQNRKRFSELFPTYDIFKKAWEESPYYVSSIQSNLKSLYWDLFANFYNEFYKYRDDIGSVLNTMHTIKHYAPNYYKKYEIVDKMRNLTEEELMTTRISLQSQGANPKIQKTMTEMIDLVDSQQVTKSTIGKLQQLQLQYNTLNDELHNEFHERFKPLFSKIYFPEETGVLFYNETI